ncbi:MAG: SdrD B-like domain-containing protein [Pirellulales bacterium]
MKNKLSLQRKRRFSFRSLLHESLETRQLMAADVSGTVYADLNRDGVRSGGENGVAGWTVFLDSNKDGVLNSGETSVVTNKDGDYIFKGVPAGNVRVAEVMQTGWVATGPMSRDLSVPTSGNVKADFFVFSGGDIKGTVWNDINQDGIRATDGSGAFTDPGLAGWTVFLDLNNNKAQDSTEPKSVTKADGSYLFTDLPPGDYEVTEVLPSGWEITKANDTRQTVAVKARTQAVQDFGQFQHEQRRNSGDRVQRRQRQCNPRH